MGDDGGGGSAGVVAVLVIFVIIVVVRCLFSEVAFLAVTKRLMLMVTRLALNNPIKSAYDKRTRLSAPLR